MFKIKTLQHHSVASTNQSHKHNYVHNVTASQGHSHSGWIWIWIAVTGLLFETHLGLNAPSLTVTYTEDYKELSIGLHKEK